VAAGRAIVKNATATGGGKGAVAKQSAPKMVPIGVAKNKLDVLTMNYSDLA
jgi:hypothetical protein